MISEEGLAGLNMLSEHTIFKSFVFFLTIVASSLSQAGQDGDSDELFSLSLKELMDVEVTSSTLTRKSLLSVPASVSVFTREQIRNMGVDYLFELINFVPGFQSFRQGAGGMQYFHSARGHRSSVKSREILILIDGVRLIRESDNGASIPMLSLHNVAKIEFIRGPGSAIYGANAFLGVINIETLRGETAVHAAAGKLGRKEFNSVQSYVEDDTEINFAINLFDEQGETYTLEDINVSPLENETGKDPRTGGDVQLFIRNGDYRLKGLLSSREAEDFYIVERASSEINHSIHENAFLHVARDIDWQQNLQSSFELGYSQNAFKLNTVIRGLGVTRTNQEETTLQFIARNAWQYASEDSLEFGLDVRNSDMTSVYNSENLGDLKFYPNSKRMITGLYVQNQRYYDNGMEVVIGGRYDDYDDVGSSFSPRISLVYPFTQQQTIKVLYGEAFRAPTPNELYLVGVTLVGNPDLKPEIIKTSELIWIGHWGSHTITLNGHYNVIENSIYSTNTFLNQTLDEAFYGMEMEYDFQLSKQWLFQINGSALESLPDSDFREADRLASFVMNYHSGPWNFNVNANYAGTREMPIGTDTKELSDYWLLNTKWIYSLNKQTNIYINGRNILNKDYYTPTRLSLHSSPMPNRGSEVVLGVEMDL